MATKTKSYGTRLSYSAAGSVYTDLTDIIGVTPPGVETADIDMSWLESPDRMREYIAGWYEGGEVPFLGHYTKAQFDTLNTLFYAGTDNYYWKISFPLIGSEVTRGTIIFRGHLKKVSFDEVNSDEDGKITCPFSIKVSGPKPTHTAAA